MPNDVRPEEDRDLDEPDDDAASRVDACRSRVAAIDAAIDAVGGRSTLAAGEVIDLLLELRSRITFSALLTDALDR